MPPETAGIFNHPFIYENGDTKDVSPFSYTNPEHVIAKGRKAFHPASAFLIPFKKLLHKRIVVQLRIQRIHPVDFLLLPGRKSFFGI